MRRLAAVAVFAVVAVIHALCPVSTSFDSRWTVPVAISVLDRGDVNLDEYLPALKAAEFYGVERVGGHYYNLYPSGGPLLATPIIGAVRLGVWAAGPVVRRLDVEGDALRPFLEGDMVRGSAVVEVVVASLLVGATAAVVFLIAAASLPLGWAGLVAFVYAFATPAWSTGSRALWQQTPSMLLLAIALWIAVRAAERPHWIAYAGVPVALLYWMRPTTALVIAAFTIYVAARYRRYLLRYCLFAAPVAVAFALFHWQVYEDVLPTYYRTLPSGGRADAIGAVAGVLVSPSRGLLVFCPWVVFALAAVRERWAGRLPLLAASMLAGHTMLFAVYSAFWYGGHSYGPRQFTDFAPLMAVLLIPAIGKWRRSPSVAAAAVFVPLLAFSVWVHARGATSPAPMRWNVDPVNVDLAPARLWDWRDPQFLRGL